MNYDSNEAFFKHLSQYAKYHQDRRNIVTHLMGIPMIVVGAAIVLSRPSVLLFDAPTLFALSPAVILAVLSAIFYIRLHWMMGLFMSVLMAAAVWLGATVALWPMGLWLFSGVGLFVVGWLLQLLGHYFEGKKPAFMDDIRGLIIGPLFVVVEVVLLCGFKCAWRERINQA